MKFKGKYVCVTSSETIIHLFTILTEYIDQVSII
jgi:hypothetical protein